jgi:hypothetical protein
MAAERIPQSDDSLLSAPLLAITEWTLRAPLTVLFGAFGRRDDAVVVIRGDAPSNLTAAIDDLAVQLRQEPQLFESVFHRRDLTRLKDKALYYLPPAELARLQEQVRSAAATTTAAAQPESALAQLNEQLARVAAAGPEQRQAREQQYAALAGPLLAAFQPS